MLFSCVLAAPASAAAQAEEVPASLAEGEPKSEATSGGDAESDPAWEAARAAATPAPQPSPAAAPNGPTSAAATEETRDTFVLLPYLGVHIPMGTLGDRYETGLHVGAILGRHLTSKLSVDGEVTLDLMDADSDSSIFKPHEYYLDFALAPLVHLRSGQILLGPKLGWFVNNRSETTAEAAPNGDESRSSLAGHSGRGFEVGANLAGLTRVGALRAGLLVSGTFRHFVAAECGQGGSAPCSGLGNVVVLSVSVTALF
jgi:hypothetical protein